MRSLLSNRVVGPIMNLINETSYSYKKGTTHLFVILNYWIITFDPPQEYLAPHMDDGLCKLYFLFYVTRPIIA